MEGTDIGGYHGSMHTLNLTSILCRCVYLFSEQSDVHGCIVGNGTSWATPQFQMLGLLEKLSVDDVGWQFGINHPIGKNNGQSRYKRVH